ncbi:MAG: SHOCT domain-containing protein [Deltaproteobacteria bacterium]|nr:SHOCT domain-containing protein [Deltaproteobacteria bacterium]
MNKLPGFVWISLVVALTGCTRWGTTQVNGPEREVGRRLLGSPAVAETRSATLGIGFAGAGGGGAAVAGLGASAGTISLKHCVQQAELTFERSFHNEPELQGRGGDLGIGIPAGAIGALVIASTAQQRSDEFSDEAISPTRGYVVGGALLSVGVALLVRSFLIVPNNRPDAEPATTRHRTETRLVQSSGCGLPGDRSQLQPAFPVLQKLDKLRAAGAISDAEYARKRQKIVDEI